MSKKLAQIPIPFRRRADTREKLKAILDFGPDTPPTEGQGLSKRVNDRIRELIKRLQEINRRVDKLNSRF